MSICIGFFALVTAVLAGAAVGRVFGWSAGDGAYLGVCVMAFIGWWVGRCAQQERKS